MITSNYLCPSCAKGKTGVIDTFHPANLPHSFIIGRRRECKACGYRFTTYELTRERIARLFRLARLPEQVKQESRRIIQALMDLAEIEKETKKQ